jgi:hypothetical protein
MPDASHGWKHYRREQRLPQGPLARAGATPNHGSGVSVEAQGRSATRYERRLAAFPVQAKAGRIPGESKGWPIGPRPALVLGPLTDPV